MGISLRLTPGGFLGEISAPESKRGFQQIDTPLEEQDAVRWLEACGAHVQDIWDAIAEARRGA